MVGLGTWLSVLIGAGATLVAGLLVYWKRQSDKRENLRRALEQEIEGMQGPLKGFAGASDSDSGPSGDILPEINFVTSVVYQNNTQHLGLLTDSEVKAVGDFYNSIIQLGRSLDMLNEHDEPTKTATYYAWFRDNGLDDVLEKNETALAELREQL